MTLAHPARQGSPEWLEARRSLVTATDIGVLLGLSPYRCEADLADEKLGRGEPSESNIRMRVGLALEDLIADEYERVTGRRVRRFRTLVTHPSIEWAGASPDGRTLGERRLVEMKWSTSRSRFADGIPQDIEAQVAWQLGVTGYPVADVAVLVGGDELQVFEQEHDPVLFDNLVAIATDFRRRLEAGGPFARDTARVKRDYPSDNGAEMVADTDLTEAVKALVDTRAARKRLQDSETAIEDAIKARMGESARLIGEGFAVSWKRTKDREVTDWKSLAAGLLRQLPQEQREPLIGIHTTVQEGFRPFRVVVSGKEDAE